MKEPTNAELLAQVKALAQQVQELHAMTQWIAWTLLPEAPKPAKKPWARLEQSGATPKPRRGRHVD